MTVYNTHVGLDDPAEYVIKIQGRLNGDLSDWFQRPPHCTTEPGTNGDTNIAVSDTITVLIGWVADQSALHGLLRHIRDLGVTLLLVDCVSGRDGRGA